MFNSLQVQGLHHARPPCPSPSPGVCSNSYPLSQWCNLSMSSYVVAFTSCLQSFPGSGSFPMIWLSSSTTGTSYLLIDLYHNSSPICPTKQWPHALSPAALPSLGYPYLCVCFLKRCSFPRNQHCALATDETD